MRSPLQPTASAFGAYSIPRFPRVPVDTGYLWVVSYLDLDSTAVEDEVPVEGGGKESLDRRIEGEDIVSDGGGIGTGGGDMGAGSSVCSR